MTVHNNHSIYIYDSKALYSYLSTTTLQLGNAKHGYDHIGGMIWREESAMKYRVVISASSQPV